MAQELTQEDVLKAYDAELERRACALVGYTAPRNRKERRKLKFSSTKEQARQAHLAELAEQMKAELYKRAYEVVKKANEKGETENVNRTDMEA